MFSFWQKDDFLATADVVIIGAGFAGLWCAYELKIRQPNLQITMLEKDSFPSGASVRNAGFACFDSPGEMLVDAATMGEEPMWQTVAMRFQGIQKLRQVLGDTAIDYDPCGGYECFNTETVFLPVRERLSWLNKGMKQITGVNAAFRIEDEALPDLGLLNFQHLVANRLEGGLHSGKALAALWQKVSALGVKVLFGCEVEGWEPFGSGIALQVKSNESFVLKTTHLLLATNAFTAQITNAVAVQPARGQVLVTEPIPNLALKGTFHFDEGFYYWRNVGNRILLGGARNTDFSSENTFTIDTSANVQQALENFMYRHIHLPQHTRINYRWAGIMGFTESKKPVLQNLQPNVWAVVACNGMGVALTPIIAENLADQMLG